MQIAGNVGYIIGRRGMTIKRIAHETGAHLKVDDSETGAEVVHISGPTRETLDAAVAQIQAVIAEADSRPKDTSSFVEMVRVSATNTH